MWWISSLCTLANEDLGTLAKYDLSQLFLCRSKQEHVVSKSQIREAVVIAVFEAKMPIPFSLPAWKVIFQGHLQNSVEEQTR